PSWPKLVRTSRLSRSSSCLPADVLDSAREPEPPALVLNELSCFNIGDIESRLPLRGRNFRFSEVAHFNSDAVSSRPPLISPSTSSQMLQMLNAFLTVQALHVAAALGIADHLAYRPRALHQLP